MNAITTYQETICENLIIASSLSDLLSGTWDVVGVLILLCTLAGLLWTAGNFVDRKISTSLKDASVIASLSLLIKPDLMFDGDGAVLSDRGAWAAIKEPGIIITKETSNTVTTTGLPVTIRIAFRKHLPTAPLLTPIGPDVIFVTSTRGSEFEWVYTLHYSLHSDNDDIAIVRTYRLELL